MRARALYIFAGVIIVILLAAPIVMGFVIERTYAALIEQANQQSGGRFALDGAIDRGLWISDAETTIRVAPGTAQEDELRVRHALVHGPVPIGELARGRSPFTLVFLVADSWFDADPEAMPNIAAALGDEALLRLVAWLHFDQSARVLLSSPPFVLADSSVDSGGLVVDVDLGPGGAPIDGTATMGATKLGSATDTSVGIDESRLVFMAESAARGSEAEARLEVGAINARGIAASVVVAPSHGAFAGVLDGASMRTGVLELVLGDIELTRRTDPGVVRRIRGTRFRQTVTENETSGLRGSETDVAIDSIDAEDGVYGPGAMRVAVRNIDPEAVEGLRVAVLALDDAALDAEALGMARLALLEEWLPRVLGPAPEIAVDELTLESPHGPLRADARLGVDGSDPALLGSPYMLMIVLQAHLNVSVAAPLMHAMVDRYLVGTVRADAGDMPEEQLLEMAGFMRDATLGQLIADGRLVLDGDTYRVEAKLAEGLPTLNGQPVDPEVLSGLLPGI